MINFRQYRNTIILLVSIIFFVLLSYTDFFVVLTNGVDHLGYFGYFLIGILFVSTFTVTPALMILLHSSQQLDPLFIAVISGLGALFGDLIIFNFLRDKIYNEIKLLFCKVNWFRISHIVKSRYIAWTIPVLGAIIIASPLPDEFGIALMSGSRLKRWQFILLSYLMNSIGIFVIIEIARL